MYAVFYVIKDHGYSREIELAVKSDGETDAIYRTIEEACQYAQYCNEANNADCFFVAEY